MWENREISVNFFPLGMSVVSYTYLLKGYHRYVYIKTPPVKMSLKDQAFFMKQQRIQLALFAYIIAPSILGVLKASSPGLKNILSINPLPSENVTTIQSNNTNMKSIAILAWINKNLPSWFKLISAMFIILILILKIIGYPSLYTIILSDNTMYFKTIGYIICSLPLIYNIFCLYIIYKFSNNSINIPKILPEFLIKWLVDFKNVSSNDNSIKAFKSMYYKGISIYVVVLIIILLI